MSKQRRFQCQGSQSWAMSKQGCENDHFKKEEQKNISNWIH